MIEWKEDYASFRVEGADYQSRREVQILGNNKGRMMTGEEMVIIALKFSKQHKCRIRSRVIYSPALIGGTVTFEVECTPKTSSFIYSNGKGTHCAKDPVVTEDDLRQYEDFFETRECHDESFSKKYWYRDNWTGDLHQFKSLAKAEEAAAREIGYKISIFTNRPYGQTPVLVKVKEATWQIP